jgi:hypothetical protein
VRTGEPLRTGEQVSVDDRRSLPGPTTSLLTAVDPWLSFGRSTDIGQSTESPKGAKQGQANDLAEDAPRSMRGAPMSYEIEGRLLEVCTCNVLCPCWVGEDPDYKTCDTTIAWGIDKGTVEGVAVDGLTIAVSAHIPRNILEPKSWTAVVFVDDRATDEQQGVLLRLFTGQLGGAVADLAGLIGEVVGVERAPISFTVDGGKGKLVLGSLVEAEMAPYIGATGKPTTLAETVFSTIPGSPVYASKASRYRRDGSGHGIPSVDLEGHNALQGHFRFAA